MKQGNKQQCPSKDAKEGTASRSHAEQLQSVVRRHEKELGTHTSLTCFNPHGLRKGAATHATSGTVMAPSVPVTVQQGEWSFSFVLDWHLHFGNSGNQCLGREKTGLDPTSLNFDCLPPHFDLNNPMSHPSVK